MKLISLLVFYSLLYSQNLSNTLAISQNGEFLVYRNSKNQISLWDLYKNQIDTVYSGFDNEIISIDVAGENSIRIAGSDRDGLMIIWERNENFKFEKKISKKNNFIKPLKGLHIDNISPMIFGYGEDSILYQFDYKKKDLGGYFYDKKSTPAFPTTAILPSGSRYYISGHQDGAVKIWDKYNLKLYDEVKFTDQPITAIDYHSHSDILIFGDDYGTIISYEVKHKLKRDLKRIDSSVRKIFINSTRNFISVDENNTIDIWNFDERLYAYKSVYTKKIDLSNIKDILFHPDKKFIYIDDGNGSVQIFDYELNLIGAIN